MKLEGKNQIGSAVGAIRSFVRRGAQLSPEEQGLLKKYDEAISAYRRDPKAHPEKSWHFPKEDGDAILKIWDRIRSRRGAQPPSEAPAEEPGF